MNFGLRYQSPALYSQTTHFLTTPAQYVNVRMTGLEINVIEAVLVVSLDTYLTKYLFTQYMNSSFKVGDRSEIIILKHS